MTDASDDEKSGYGHPPRKHQFQKGQSGNPDCRPPGAKNKLPRGGLDRIFEIIRTEANREIKVTEGEKRVTVPMVQAIMRSLAVKAGKGTVSAQRLFLETALDAEKHIDRRQATLVDAVVHFKLGWQQRFEECDEVDEPRPDISPHPDDLHIDPLTGEVFVLGPLTKEQRDRENENLRSVIKEDLAKFKVELKEFEEQLKSAESPEDLELIKFLIATRKAAIKRFQKILRTLKGRFRIRRLLSPDSTGNPYKIEHY